MKKSILALFLICLVIFSVNTADAEVKKAAGYISLNASKTLELEPNRVQISFSVETNASDAQSAVKENNEISNKIITALKTVTNSQGDIIRTNNFSVRPNYLYGKDGVRRIKNYIAVNSVTVNTKDIKNIAKIIDTAIANGANRTDNLSYTYENSASVCQNVYPELMKELKLQASGIASASGASLDGIKSVSTSCSSNMAISNGRFYNMAVAADTGGVEEAVSTPVEAGKVTVRVSVNADYYVK